MSRKRSRPGVGGLQVFHSEQETKRSICCVDNDEDEKNVVIRTKSSTASLVHSPQQKQQQMALTSFFVQGSKRFRTTRQQNQRRIQTDEPDVPGTQDSSPHKQNVTPTATVSPPTSAEKTIPNNNSIIHSNKKKKLTQVYLDCGQSQFGQQSCKKCGMLYMPGVAEDVKAHQKFCQDHTQGMRWFLSSNPSSKKKSQSSSSSCSTRILWQSTPTKNSSATTSATSIFNYKPTYAFLRDPPKLGKDAGPQLILSIPATSKSSQISPQLVSLLQNHIVPDLGMDSETAIQQCLQGCSVWMYLQNQRVVGLVTTQPIAQAYHIPNYLQQSSSSTTPNTNERIPKKALLGIALLWTHPSHRKQGIARTLVDVARQYAYFGVTVRKTQVAISSPTQAGWSFAKAYTEAEDGPLIYDL